MFHWFSTSVTAMHWLSKNEFRKCRDTKPQKLSSDEDHKGEAGLSSDEDHKGEAGFSRTRPDSAIPWRPGNEGGDNPVITGSL